MTSGTFSPVTTTLTIFSISYFMLTHARHNEVVARDPIANTTKMKVFFPVN